MELVYMKIQGYMHGVSITRIQGYIHGVSIYEDTGIYLWSW